MPNLNPDIDVRLLTRWLSTQGVKAGLKESKYITVETLGRLAKGLGIEHGKKATRQELIDEIVRVASKRIDKSVDQIYRMEQDEIIGYFDDIGVESEELLDLLKQLDLDPGRKGKFPPPEPILARENPANH